VGLVILVDLDYPMVPVVLAHLEYPVFPDYQKDLVNLEYLGDLESL
jgi:hypothetical protein